MCGLPFFGYQLTRAGLVCLQCARFNVISSDCARATALGLALGGSYQAVCVTMGPYYCFSGVGGHVRHRGFGPMGPKAFPGTSAAETTSKERRSRGKGEASLHARTDV